MKLKLTLTSSELQALINVARWFTGRPTINDFNMYSYVTTLEVFVMQHATKFVTGTVKPKKNRITLSDMQTLAFYYLLTSCTDRFPSFEYFLADRIVTLIRRQHSNEEMLRMGIRH